MSQSSTFTFVISSSRGHQKIRLNAKRMLLTLPAHKRLTPFDKLMKKRRFTRESSDKRPV